MTGTTFLGHPNLRVDDFRSMAHFYRDQVGFQDLTLAPPDGPAGVTHFCLAIEDLDVEKARLATSGVALTSSIKLGRTQTMALGLRTRKAIG